MKKTIITVFLIIGVLVLGLIVWSLFFNEGGVLQTGWNAVADQVNSTWQKLTGGGEESILIRKWTTGGKTTVGEAGGDVTASAGASGN